MKQLFKRVAIYVRVSTAAQEDRTSLDTQLAACERYARERGYTVVATYREVFSGAKLWERPQLNNPRASMRRRDVDVIVAYAIDRLSRDEVHLGVILSEAEHAGVNVEFVSEPLDGSPEAGLVRYVRGYSARIEREKIRERSIRGRRARIEGGRLMPSNRPLYGYRWRDEIGVRAEPRHGARRPGDLRHGPAGRRAPRHREAADRAGRADAAAA
jgi:site-specific DNA recombinase